MNNKTESKQEKQEKATSGEAVGERRTISQGVIILLNWLAVIATAILLACIYIPKSIWAEEDQYRTESQRRMQIIQKAEYFHNIIRGGYTEDGEFLFKLISQTHDSLIADTTFLGDQIVNVDGEPVSVLIPPQDFGVQMDTTFTVGRQLRREVLDTVYTITEWNTERAAMDTSYVNGSAALDQRMQNVDFREVLNTSYGSHTEIYTDYKWNRYRLEPELLLCPVTGEPYIIDIDTISLELTIASPIYEKGYTEPRYLFFEFQALDHGEIVDGNPSWSNQ